MPLAFLLLVRERFPDYNLKRLLCMNLLFQWPRSSASVCISPLHGRLNPWRMGPCFQIVLLLKVGRYQ